MTTSCLIGLKTEKGIDAVICMHDGYISHTGLILYMFYNDIEKIRRLFCGGNIEKIGVHENYPSLPYKNSMEFDMCFYTNIKYKTSFTKFAMDNSNVKHFKNLNEMMAYWGNNYAFVYDTNNTYNPGMRWLVIGSNGGKTEKDAVVFNIKFKDLFKSITPIQTLMKSYGRTKMDAEIEFDSLKIKYEHFKKFKSQKNLEICEDWIKLLKKNNLLVRVDLNNRVLLQESSIRILEDLEIGYSHTQSEGKTYAIYKKLQDGQSKRTCLKRSKDLNEIVLHICIICGIHIFARPIFDEDSKLA